MQFTTRASTARRAQLHRRSTKTATAHRAVVRPNALRIPRCSCVACCAGARVGRYDCSRCIVALERAISAAIFSSTSCFGGGGCCCSTATLPGDGPLQSVAALSWHTGLDVGSRARAGSRSRVHSAPVHVRRGAAPVELASTEVPCDSSHIPAASESERGLKWVVSTRAARHPIPDSRFPFQDPAL